jgi:hypothetical protein
MLASSKPVNAVPSPTIEAKLALKVVLHHDCARGHRKRNRADRTYDEGDEPFTPCPERSLGRSLAQRLDTG